MVKPHPTRILKRPSYFHSYLKSSQRGRIERSIHALIKNKLMPKNRQKKKMMQQKVKKIIESYSWAAQVFHTLFIWATLHLVCSDLNGHLYDIATKSVMMAPIFPLKNETPSSANDVSLPAPRGSLSFESHRSAPAHFAVIPVQWGCSVDVFYLILWCDKQVCLRFFCPLSLETDNSPRDTPHASPGDPYIL